MNGNRNIFAIIISPVIGGISFLILFFINKQIDTYYPKEMVGPIIGDGILYSSFFPILLVGALIFQIIILEPIFRGFKKRNLLNKSLIKRIFLIIIISFSLIFALLFGTIQFGITDYLIALLIGFFIWSSYFLPNMTTYYLVYVRKIEMNMGILKQKV